MQSDSNRNFPPRIVLTPGEPAGIGPDITLQIAQRPFAADIIIVADPNLLTQRAKQLNIPIIIKECGLDDAPTLHQPGSLRVYPCHLEKPAVPGHLETGNAQYVIDTLTIAANACLKQQAKAIVTGPVHKSVINDAGISFTGHTEFFAQHCHAPKTIMLFVTKEMRVALATTHLPLKDVPHAITRHALQTTLELLDQSLKTQFHIEKPRILVAGLNPHAGEGGYLGREEIQVITPTIKALQAQDRNIIGPLPADTLFTPHYLKQADAILAMYHDQALPVVKYLGFGQAVNVTLGLPFIRTSVDHGTALDLAGTGRAESESLQVAVELAIEMINQGVS